MTKTSVRAAQTGLLIAATVALACTAAPGFAHHSFAMFDSSQHMLVEGTVTRWDYNSPHSWLYIEFEDENGEVQQWGFEGAAPVHAARQGVTGNTFSRGEQIRVVMSPLRDGRQAGALCFVVKEDGSKVRPNDGVCDSVAVIEVWESNGWLETTPNLASHPHENDARRPGR